MSEKCKQLFPHEDPINLNKFFGDPRGRNGQVDSKWYRENIVKWTPPYPLFYSDGKRTPLRTLLLHKKVVDVYTAAYTEVAKEFTPADLEDSKLMEKISTEAMELCLAAIKKTIHDDLHIHFDVWTSERVLRKSHKVEAAIAKLKELGFTYEKEGALYLQTTKFGDLS